MEIFKFVSFILSVILLSKFIIFALFLYLHFSKLSRYKKAQIKLIPDEFSNKGCVSVLVPCYNEEKTLTNCINSLLDQSYPNYEIIIIDDGSTDNTANLASFLAENNEKVKFIIKSNGGKASALNSGIEQAQGDIIVSIDADSIFRKDTIARLVENFADSSVGAVCGNVKVINREKELTKHQALEYITGLNIERRTFAYLDCVQVIPGAIGAFRKEALDKVSGYSEDTIVEDMDITIAISNAGHKVVFDPEAIAYTEAPENLYNFYKQRYRWSYGMYQVIKKYRHLLFNIKIGKQMGFIGLPYFLFFPVFYSFASLFFFLTFFMAIRLDSIGIFLYAFFITIVAEFILLYYVFYIDRENKRLLSMLPIQYLWYRHFIALINIIALFSFIVGKEVKWNKIERLGKNFVFEKI